MHLTPLRSLLFLPALASAMLAKATERGADALIVDLEDSIPLARKAEARLAAASVVNSLAERGACVLVRLNPTSPQWRLDLEHLPLQQLAALMLPKVEALAQIDELAAALDAAGAARLPIAALIESPRGVLACSAIASHPRLCALGFGAEDYAAALGVAPCAAALTFPGAQVLTAAHAFDLPCWGLPDSIAEVADVERFSAAVQAGRAMGFTGSVCIHPKQVPIVNQGFSPSDTELAWAERVLQADAQAQAQGLGAVLLDGRMIDRPIVDRARRWLAGRG